MAVFPGRNPEPIFTLNGQSGIIASKAEGVVLTDRPLLQGLKPQSLPDVRVGGLKSITRPTNLGLKTVAVGFDFPKKLLNEQVRKTTPPSVVLPNLFSSDVLGLPIWVWALLIVGLFLVFRKLKK